MGIALQLRMVAEASRQDFRSESQEIKSIDVLGNISELYHKFIDRKYDIYFREKLEIGLMPKFPSEELKTLRDSYDKMHRKLAICEISQNVDFLTFFQTNLENDQRKNEDMEWMFRIGLVVKSEFIHHTFTEYFASGLLCNYLRKKTYNQTKYLLARKFLLMNIFKKKNWVIFDFMDESLKTNLEWASIKKCNLLCDAEETYNKSELEHENLCSLTSDESLHDLHNLVKNGMEKKYGKLYYNGDLSSIKDLYQKFFIVTDVKELKPTLDFLLEAHRKKSKYELANKAIALSITEAAMHYFYHDYKQNHTLNNEYFKEVVESLSSYSQCIIISDLLEMGKLFESKDLQWLEDDGLKISRLSMILTQKMAEIFISIISVPVSKITGWESNYAVNIFKKLILPLLTAMHNEEYMPYVDKLSLLNMFQKFAEFISKNPKCRLPIINTKQLKTLLDYIKSLIEIQENPNKEELFIAINSLTVFNRWNINLIDFEQKLLIQDSVGDFNYELSLTYKDKIIKLIRWKLASPQGDSTKESSELVSLISSV